MNRLKSSIAMTLSRYPWIGQDDLIDLYLDFIEKEYLNIIKKGTMELQIPDSIYSKQTMYKERRKPKKIRRTSEELQRKRILINWLKEIQSGERKVNSVDQDHVSFEWENIENSSEKLIQQDKENYNIDSSLTEIVSKLNHINLEMDDQKDSEKTGSNISRDILFDFSEDKDRKLKDIIVSSARDSLIDIKKYYEDNFGYITEITLDLNDEDALKIWLVIIDKIISEKLDEKVIVKWTRENKLNDKEIMEKIIDIMVKSDLGPKRSDRFAANKEIYVV